MFLKITNFIAVLLSVSWLARSLDWEPAITSLCLIAALVAQEIRSIRVNKNKRKQLEIISNNNWQDPSKILKNIQDIVDEYFKGESNKLKIESKTFISMVNIKYIENMRTFLSHLLLALKLSLNSGYDNQVKSQFENALNALKKLDLDGFEYLAGHHLKSLRERIESAGYLTKIGNASSMFEKANEEFKFGRTFRLENKEKSMNYYEKCIDICKKALEDIGPEKKLFGKSNQDKKEK